MEKYVYLFREGNKDMKELLGGKGANLAEMTNIGLPVPSGFTVTTESCNKYYEDNEKISEEVKKQIFEAITSLEEVTGKKFGLLENPLLVSVRSGARASMPGMMDTILNLGINDEVATSFAIKTNNKRFVYDSYRRFIAMFADVVKGIDKNNFEKILEETKNSKNIKYDTELTEDDMYDITLKYKDLYKQLNGSEFPQDPKTQLLESIQAVFRSWNNERAIVYRKMNEIPGSWGTAVNVQEMVYGNSGDKSGTGVAFTRNPATGEKKLYGEYLINAQGEDVVAGIRTPESIETLQNIMPEVYDQFTKFANILENHYKDMQDMEFTIENGKLFMLQTRNGKRTTSAALKIVLDLLDEKMITEEEAVLRINPNDLNQLLHPNFDLESLKNGKVIAEGLAASPGAGTGRIYFNAKDVMEASERGEETLLVRLETSPEDISGMAQANGILTIRGGMTSHAAVVARGMGRCCVCGCSSLAIDGNAKTLTTSEGIVYKESDYMSIDGTTGKVYGEQIETVEPSISGDFETYMKIADKYRTLKVKVNADTPRDAMQALKFGAEGIGLCRTEHMFFSEERIFQMRRMITATTKEQRIEALNELLIMQRNDFVELFRTMAGYSVTIRYLDPPLHEFLPHTEDEIRALSKALNITYESLKNRIEDLKEFNPMMGHRGCRLDVTYPEIAVMQTRAVMEAAIMVEHEGKTVKPQIMIPLITDLKELEYVKSLVVDIADKVLEVNKSNLKYQVGTMIETPRACMLADEIATAAEFFSFGTNDLTQLTYGFSRDDAAKFLNDYYDKKIFENDPFAKIDQNGVGLLMQYAITCGKKTRKNIELGICGEHAGEPSSVEFCHQIGLDYVSCSPFRIPVARLAAAQANIKNK